MVEAAGVEPYLGDHPNMVMAHDFRNVGPNSLPRLAVCRFTRVYSSPLHSIPVRET